jgi:putative inorganic carbon (hco3(-)) transporter
VSASTAQVIGALIACAGAGAGLILRDPRLRYAAVGIGLLAAIGLIVGEVWDQERFVDLRSEPGVVVLGVLLGGMALGATAATFVRNPEFVAIAAFAVIPLRIPVQVGDETNYLLVPLYGVIAGGWVRGAWLVWRRRSEELQGPRSPSAEDPALVRWLCIALAASLVIYAMGLAWSEDPTNAIINVAFFLAPFAALLVLLRDLRWFPRLVGHVLVAFAAVCAAFGALAIWQYVDRDLFLNDQLQDANQLHLYFRVNSVFRDPNVLGRYLALAIVALGAWAAWRRPTRQAVAGALTGVFLLVALTFTFSQTSFIALIAGLALLVWFRLGGRGFAVAAALLASAAAVASFAGPASDESISRERDDLGESTSGRTGLIEGGIDLFEREPVAGQGAGSFAINFRKYVEKIEKPVSHTEPVTVAAEQGVIGLIPYGAVVILSVFLLVRPWPSTNGARAGLAACYVALLIHSLGYAGFAIDPITWAFLAMAITLRE